MRKVWERKKNMEGKKETLKKNINLVVKAEACIITEFWQSIISMVTSTKVCRFPLLDNRILHSAFVNVVYLDLSSCCFSHTQAGTKGIKNDAIHRIQIHTPLHTLRNTVKVHFCSLRNRCQIYPESKIMFYLVLICIFDMQKKAQMNFVLLARGTILYKYRALPR